MSDTKISILVKGIISSCYYCHPNLIWINEQVIHDCPKPEDFIENKTQSLFIFICVRRQKSGNFHILYWDVASTKRRHIATFPIQLVQPKLVLSHEVLYRVSKSAHTCVPGVLQC